MKTMKYFVWAAFALALGACTDENEFLDASKQITVEAGFGASSRVATNGLSSIFEADDAIGVYVWTGGTILPDAATGYVANNVTNTYNGTKWTATPQMFWKDAETPHYFLAVYPQTDILASTTYTLDATDQEKSDLLVATNFGKDNGGIVAQSNPVPLAFGHVMAKLRVNIKFNDEFTTAPTVEHVTVGAHATATIDWQTATATATGNATGIELPALATAAQGYACSYESVMVPQSGFKSVVMVIGGETYTFTSNQAMQLKKGTITTLNLTVGLSTIQAEDISILDWTTGASIDGYLNNISEQITAINASLTNLKDVDVALQDLIDDLEGEAVNLKTQLDSNTAADAATKQALETKIAAIEALITILQTKDAELDGKIAALQAYVNSEITATEDWATTTFATLAQYQAVLNDIAEINLLIEQNKTAIEDITNDLASMQTAIDNLHTSMQTWVNEQLQEPLADIATLQADLTNLRNSVATDAELTAAIAEQQTALDNAMNGVSQTIREAITAAIGNGGTIDLAISQKIDAAKTELQSQISTINSAITTIQDRLDKLEKRIQSIRFIPEYSDGKVKIESGMSAVELTFIVSPKEAAAIAADKVTAFIYHTQSRAVDATRLNVTGVIGDVDTGMLTVSVTPPAETYWSTGKTANIYIQINDGNNDIISEMIPAYYYDYVTFSAASVQTLNLVQTKSQKLDEYDEPVYEDDEGTIPVLVPNPYPGYGDDTGYIEFSVGNSNEWTKFTPASQPVPFGGDKGDLHLRGISPNGTLQAQIVFGNNTTPVACSGDIRTLVDWENYETAVTSSAIFYGLFENCTVLTSAPELPAPDLAEQCYWSMFWGCTSLAVAPELPATTLANSCYVNMFHGCTKLTEAPELKAAMLVEGCYNGMFFGCTNLNSITMLATDINAVGCLDSWVNGVADSGTFTKAAGMTAIPTNSVSGIPTGWTVKNVSSSGLNNFGFGGNLTPSDN